MNIMCYFELGRYDSKTHTERTKSSTLSWPVFVLVPKATGGKSLATQSRKHSVLCSHQFCHTVWEGCENDPRLALTMKPNDVLTTNEWQMLLFFILWEGKDIKQGYEPGRNKQVSWVKEVGAVGPPPQTTQQLYPCKQVTWWLFRSTLKWKWPKRATSMTMEGSEREVGRMNIKTINCSFILFRQLKSQRLHVEHCCSKEDVL